jgi:hypothetical protein
MIPLTSGERLQSHASRVFNLDCLTSLERTNHVLSEDMSSSISLIRLSDGCM